MFRELLARFNQGYRTAPYPRKAPTLPERLAALPVINSVPCAESCSRCVDACPTDAIALREKGITLDLGRCLFCTECQRVCPEGSIRFTNDHRMAVRSREDLVLDGRTLKLADALEGKTRKILGRALRLRQVSAGGCNACEADTNVLNTLVFDLGRFGIQFVASPRHADGILITGPIPENMRLGLMKTWESVPDPRIVIAVGACAISGGPYLGHPEVHDGSEKMVPVDLYIPGCPPHPYTILDGLLRLIGRIESDSRGSLSLNR